MKELLSGKTAVITGTNRGIGKAIAKKFAEQGCNIFACARGGEYKKEFENFLSSLENSFSIKAMPLYFDITNREHVKDAFKKIRSTGLPLDILVNNAGILSDNFNFAMMPPDKVRSLFEVNYFSQIEFTQLLLRLLFRNKSKEKSIVFISSIAAFDGFFSSFDYCASKAAINATVIQLARELGHLGIRVNAVAPGIIKTDMTENYKETLNSLVEGIILGRFGDAEEIASVVAFLASEEASYITGQIIRADGGTSPQKANL